MKIQERMKEYLHKSLGERCFSIVRSIAEICFVFCHNELSITIKICKLITALTGTLAQSIISSKCQKNRKKEKK